MGNIEDGQMEDWRQFLAERHEVLMALDVERFRQWLAKHGERDASERSERVLLAGMHYARINASSVPDADKEVSRTWLTDSGFSLHPQP